jgi:hypothetical protein
MNYYDVNGDKRSDGCECYDTEVYSSAANAHYLGSMDDADGVDFNVYGRIPQTSASADWYYFYYDDTLFSLVEFYAKFTAPVGTSMRLTLYNADGITVIGSVVSYDGAQVVLTDSYLDDGYYFLKVEAELANSCSTYSLIIGDGSV